MSQWLREVRKKPKHVRDNIAFGISGGFTALLALGWFLVSGAPSSDNSKDEAFFKTFLGQFKEQFATVNEALPKATTTSPMVLPGSTSSMIIAPASTSTAPSSGNATSTQPRTVIILPVKTSTSSLSSSSTVR